jgi:metallo-beta-lactamase family protein
VLLVGFMAENTLGKRLRDGEKEVRILDAWYKVKATVDQIHAFSAHADYTEIGDWLDAIDTSRLRRIFLVHGEPEGQLHLYQYLAEKGYRDIEIVKYGETYAAGPV